MRQKRSSLLFLALSLTMYISCNKSNDPAEQLPEWNKNRTITIQFYSRLTKESLFKTADYSQAMNQIRSGNQQVAVFHRADVIYETAVTVNPTVSVASEAGKVPFFVCNRYSGNRAEGSGILIGHTVARMEAIPVSTGCTWFLVPTRVNTAIAMNFATISFENESQMTSGAEIIRKNLTDETVLVGVVDKTHKDKLTSEFAAKSYRVSLIESTNSQASQSLFVLTTQKWVVREHTETPIGTDGILSFNLQIEAL